MAPKLTLGLPLLLTLAGCSSDSGPGPGGDGGTAGGQDALPGADLGPPPNCGTPNPAMSFFVTARGSGGVGGNLGGLAGADARCAAAAAGAGAQGKTWRAYLSTSQVDARDRIGAGPWFDHAGQSVGDLASIHYENGGTGIPVEQLLTECGTRVLYDTQTSPDQTKHDILTGSDRDGRLRRTDQGEPFTCNDWTSNADAPYRAWVGHSDYDGPGGAAWNSVHDTAGCTEAQFLDYSGNGGLYCFAID